MEYSVLSKKILKLREEWLLRKELQNFADYPISGKTLEKLNNSSVNDFLSDFLNNFLTFSFYKNKIIPSLSVDNKFSKPVLDYLTKSFDFSSYTKLHTLNQIKKYKLYITNNNKLKSLYRSLSNLLLLNGFYNLEVYNQKLQLIGLSLFDINVYSFYFFDFRGRKYPVSNIYPTSSRLCRLLHYYG